MIGIENLKAGAGLLYMPEIRPEYVHMRNHAVERILVAISRIRKTHSACAVSSRNMYVQVAVIDYGGGSGRSHRPCLSSYN